MQVQFYNQEKKYSTFVELLKNVPNAERLHFLVSPSVTGYLQQLNGVIPEVLNSLGKQFLPFKNFKFEIVDSDVKYKSAHRVAINFFSEPMRWHDTIGEQLLVSETEGEKMEDGDMTHLLSLQPSLSIYSLKEEAQ